MPMRIARKAVWGVLAALLVLVPATASAQITLGTSGKSAFIGDGTTTQDVTIDPGTRTNGLLQLWVFTRTATGGSPNTISSIVCGGETLTGPSGGALLSVNRSSGGLDYLTTTGWVINPDAGSQTCVITQGSAYSGAMVVLWHAYDGALQDQNDVQDQSATGSNNGDPTLGSITPGENDELVTAAFISEANDYPSISTGSGCNCLTEPAAAQHDSGNWTHRSGYTIQTTAAAITAIWDGTDSDWSGIITSFKEEPAANSPPTVTLGSPADAGTVSSLTPTLTFSCTDSEGDDCRFQIQITDNPSDFLESEGTADEFPSGGGGISIHPGPTGGTTHEGANQVDDRPCQSFTGDGRTISKAAFYLGDDDVNASYPVGNFYIRLYDHTGTYGTSSALIDPATGSNAPTLDWLAKSDALAVTASSLLTGALYDVSFTGANRVRLANGSYYLICADWDPDDTDTANDFSYAGDGISSGTGHDGNYFGDGGLGGGPGVNANWDMYFRVKTVYTLLSEVSGTDSGFANISNGGDTDPFNDGDTIGFTVQSGDTLSNGVTYYWRARAIDPSGSNTYGSYTSTRSFTVGIPLVPRTYPLGVRRGIRKPDHEQRQ